MTDRSDLPVGTVTFLRTDVEGSMALARELGRDWDRVNDEHVALLRGVIDDHHGVVVRTEGDAVFAVFPEAGAAVAAAVDAQRAIQAHPWPDGLPIRVRIGLHTGEAHLAGDDYGGFEVNRAARIAAAGHGGQVLLSEATATLVADQLPPGTQAEDLGRFVLRDLPRPERLVQLSIDGLPASFPPPRTAGPAGSLPGRMTSFIGRDAEIEMAVALLRDARLVTLTGPGGIGKSSLALEVARAVAPDYPDGAWFIALADIDDAAELSAAIAHGIGLFDGPERTAAAALLRYIAGRSFLLVLDNLEHLLDGSDQIAAILRASPKTRILGTSRAPLHLSGEQELPVRPLVDEGVRLFIDRAGAVRPGWDPGADRPIVEEICDLVDHLPLGIELAAARVGALPPAVVRDRLAAHLPLPGPGTRDAPARQRTLEGTVAWSHDLLDGGRQRLLHRLGVFDGGFDIEQVDAIMAPASVEPGSGRPDLLEDLLDLADRSLVVPDAPHGGRVRFHLLRTIQAFALDRLVADGDEPEVRRRHAEANLELVDECSRHLNTSRHAEMLDRIDPEIPNLRAALRWTIESGAGDLALRLAGRLWRFWHAFGLLDEGRRLTTAALDMPGAPTSGSARAWAEAAAGSLAYWQGDSATARARYEEQLEVARAAADEAAIADALFNLGHVTFLEHEDEAVQLAYMDDVIARYRDLGDERTLAKAAWSRGILAMAAGRPDEAAVHLEGGLAEFERLDDRQYYAMTITSLGWAAWARGEIGEACRLAVEGLLATYAMRDIGTTTVSLHIGVLMAAMLGRSEEGAEIHGAFDALCERYGVRPPASLGRFMDLNDPFEAIRSQLPPEEFAAAYARGGRMTLDEAVAAVVRLGEAATTLDGADQTPEARER